MLFFLRSITLDLFHTCTILDALKIGQQVIETLKLTTVKLIKKNY